MRDGRWAKMEWGFELRRAEMGQGKKKEEELFTWCGYAFCMDATFYKHILIHSDDYHDSREWIKWVGIVIVSVCLLGIHAVWTK